VRGVHLLREQKREVPPDLEHQGVHPGLEPDLPVVLRQDRGVLVAIIRDPGDRHAHPRRPLGRRQRRPSRERGLRRGDRIGDVRGRRRCRLAHDRVRLPWIRDAEHVVREALLAADEQACAYADSCGVDRSRIRHGDCPPLCVRRFETTVRAPRSRVPAGLRPGRFEFRTILVYM
jgi:hypothetical protein